MLEDNQELDSIKELLSKKSPVIRAQAFQGIFTNETLRLTVQEGNASAAMTVTLMTLIHTCNRHPEWMRAVVEDSQWVIQGDEKEVEDALMEICGWYLLPRREYVPSAD